MTISSLPDSAIVPTPNNGTELSAPRKGATLPQDLLEEVFSYLSPKELFSSNGVNKHWHAITEGYLNSVLEEPRNLKGPIYTRAELVEKIKQSVSQLQPNQQIRLKVAQFRKKETPHSQITTSFSLIPNPSPLSQQQPATMKIISALLDEVNNQPYNLRKSFQANLKSEKSTIQASHFFSLALEDLGLTIQQALSEKIDEVIESDAVSARRATIMTRTTIALLALTTLYFLLNT